MPGCCDRGARNPGGVFSRLIDRRPLARGGKEAALMFKVVGTESTQDEVEGRSLLDEIAREGARRMLVAALESEVAAYLEAHSDAHDAEGHALVVRNGKGRTRKITLGAGTIPVSAPRVNDRRINAVGERSRFTSRILPRTCGAPRRWPRSCRCSTCGGYPPATSARRSRRCSGMMPPACPPRISRA